VKPPSKEIVENPEALLTWLKDLWLYVNAGNKKVYNQNDEPTIGKNQTALWIDADAGPKYYVLANFDGTQKKGELT